MRHLVVVLVLVLAVTACGESAPPPAGEAKQAAMRYYAAFARADGDALCRELTARARRATAVKGRVSSCAEAVEKDAGAYPEEVRRRVLFATIGSPQVDGDHVVIEVDGDDMFTERSRHTTLLLEAHNGRWAIGAYKGNDKPDAVTICAVGGLEGWSKGDVDPFWKKQGRAVFDVYMSRFCKRMIAEHAMADPLGDGDPTPKEERAIDKLADRVLEQMVRDGSISTD